MARTSKSSTPKTPHCGSQVAWRSTRIPDEAIERLKKNVSLVELCRSRGIYLERHGQHDLAASCPFHDEKEASFIVSPGKNLFHCLGCDAAGSVIDLVMRLDGLEFRAAAEELLTQEGVLQFGSELECKHATIQVSPEKATGLLERVVEIYEQNLASSIDSGQAASDEAKGYLESRGITNAGTLSRFRVGYSHGTLHDILPTEGQLKEELQAVGILLPGGSERFEGCVVFPVYDEAGNLVTLCGRSIHGRHHLFLPGRPKGLWNEAAGKMSSEIILTESVLDALSVMEAGYHHVMALHGTSVTTAACNKLTAFGVQKLTLLLDGDAAGQKAAAKIKHQWSDLSAQRSVEVKTLPDEHDPNSYLKAHGAEALYSFLAGDPEDSRQATPVDVAESPPTSPLLTLGRRHYHIHGLEKGPRKLKATFRIEHAGRLHVDTLDLYSARSRRTLAQDLCRVFEEVPETIEADVTKLLRHCESLPEKSEISPTATPEQVLTPAGRAEAEAFGKRRDLIETILSDFEINGLKGERANKLLGYLSMTSRKMANPLSVLILSSSGAGKTALQDACLSFCPPEDVVKLTSLSGKALFYKDQMSLKHKVLALEEGAGAEEASYAIRNLISAGELVIESTIKDQGSGRLTTMENRVEGPTVVLITTTNPNTNPETKSRFWITSVDESREQTRAILEFQRQRRTLEGVAGDHRIERIRQRHHNFQRLLKPVTVVNPFAEELTYEDDRLQGRRDQPKYLNLINAVAFLHQLQKRVSSHGLNPSASSGEPGSSFEYVLVDREDVRIANELANDILGKSLDELSRPSRDLLMQLHAMLKKRTDPHEDEAVAISRPSFTRRDVREFTGWSNYRVHTHLKELVEFEYVLADSGRNGSLYRYRLFYDGEGQDGKTFTLGLRKL